MAWGARLAAGALATGLAFPATAGAQEYAETLAKRVEREVVYVESGARPEVSSAAAGRIRLRILDKAIGRIKIAVVREGSAAENGGVTGLAHAVSREGRFPGTLMIVAGFDAYALTSHPAADVTVQAVTEAFKRHEGDRTKQLVAAVDGIAATDPGRSADLGAPGGAPPGFDGDLPNVDDVDGIFDAVRIGTIVIMAAVALPFLLLAGWLVLRFRRQAKRGEVMEEDQRQNVGNQLIALGDQIRALDLDAQMPGVTSTMLSDYEGAIAQYDRANDLLMRGEDLPHRVSEASAAIAEGMRRIEAAKQRLGTTRTP